MIIHFSLKQTIKYSFMSALKVKQNKECLTLISLKTKTPDKVKISHKICDIFI